jgi:hypothetical protein
MNNQWVWISGVLGGLTNGITGYSTLGSGPAYPYPCGGLGSNGGSTIGGYSSTENIYVQFMYDASQGCSAISTATTPSGTWTNVGGTGFNWTVYFNGKWVIDDGSLKTAANITVFKSGVWTTVAGGGWEMYADSPTLLYVSQRSTATVPRYSADGTNWVSAILPSSAPLCRTVVFTGTQWLAIPCNAAGTQITGILVSRDGYNWQLASNSNLPNTVNNLTSASNGQVFANTYTTSIRTGSTLYQLI